ncbi:TPA: hypothetical protein ACPKAL_003665 [Vibrio alginolyticus]|uniref:hypothetical protein n=1 Tax=Vibrio alginolyticus TaxID=663 RepID=UPI00063DB784|nr:hypothetical protein [Vibrio alginolyticus]HCG9568325.1 hypothetical protein [Vibrio parahaemolyticus]EJL8716084.1 hypothetical protein [Vibrio alginolyticus]KLI71180.1 hypothetical protein AAW26_16825 [Vibrio alginolyticus]MDM4739671.1 hypothetical protein [Vibrio alginolyticus]MDM4760020.1 hypothetical protein [Vibrio alginolyticus]
MKNLVKLVGKSYAIDANRNLIVFHIGKKKSVGLTGATLIAIQSVTDGKLSVFQEDRCEIPFCVEVGDIPAFDWLDEQSRFWDKKLIGSKFIIPKGLPSLMDSLRGETSSTTKLEIDEVDVRTKKASEIAEFFFKDISTMMKLDSLARLREKLGLSGSQFNDLVVKPITIMCAGHFTETDHFAHLDESLGEWGSSKGGEHTRYSEHVAGEWKFFKVDESEEDESENEIDKELGDLICESRLMNEKSWGLF